MNKELLARFLPRFIEAANKRLELLTDLLSRRNEDGVPAKVRGEYHSLAGEASMLGLVEIGKEARGAENAAVAWQGGDTKAMMVCLRSLRTLAKAVSGLSSMEVEADDDSEEESSEESTPEASDFCVLVVDDSPINADTVVDALEEAGMIADSAMDLAGVDAAIAAMTPHLVLADVNMPGIELSDVVAHVKRSCAAKIYLLSGLSDEELAVLTTDTGADGFVSKSAGLDALVARVAKVRSVGTT